MDDQSLIPASGNRNLPEGEGRRIARKVAQELLHGQRVLVMFHPGFTGI
jgi:hypothetical protein